MAIKTGRYGRVRYNAAGSSPSLLTIAALDSWKLSLKQDFEDVTSFQDTNKVYVPGMMDISGSMSGHLDATDLVLVAASHAATPGILELIHNTLDTVGSPLNTVTFSGLAYLDTDIDTGVRNAPKMTSNFRAAGSWVLPA